MKEALEFIGQHMLKNKASMHIFLSGGGLRVVRMEAPPYMSSSRPRREGKLIGYGEDPTVEDAFDRLIENIKNKKSESDYLTGQSAPSSWLDAWIRKGSGFESWVDGEWFVVQLKGYADKDEPADLRDRVFKGRETIVWKDEARGYTYRSSPSRFPNGEIGMTTACIEYVPGRPQHRAWSYYTTKTARDRSFMEAINGAFAAPQFEIDE